MQTLDGISGEPREVARSGFTHAYSSHLFWVPQLYAARPGRSPFRIQNGRPIYLCDVDRMPGNLLPRSRSVKKTGGAAHAARSKSTASSICSGVSSWSSARSWKDFPASIRSTMVLVLMPFAASMGRPKAICGSIAIGLAGVSVSRQLDQPTIPLEQELARIRAQCGTQQKTVDLEVLLGIANRAAQRIHLHAVIGSQRPQDVRLNQVPE